MSTTIISVEEAQTRLAELIAQAEQGEEVVIEKDDQQVKLVPVRGKAGRRVFGQYRGKARMSDDFDAPLPDDFWNAGS